MDLAITDQAMVHVAHVMAQASVDHVTELEEFKLPILTIPPQCKALGINEAIYTTNDFYEMSGELDLMVGTEGFEPPTLCSQNRCATRLRYVPTQKMMGFYTKNIKSARAFFTRKQIYLRSSYSVMKKSEYSI